MQMVFLCTPIIICVITGIYFNVEVESIFFFKAHQFSVVRLPRDKFR